MREVRIQRGSVSATARHAFTLVELLVVIGIIALLLGILLPALAKARDSARKAKCSANLHNWGIACFAFAADRKGVFPTLWKHRNNVHFPTILDYSDYYQQNGSGWANATPSAQGPDAWKYWGTSLEVLAKYGILKGDLPPAEPPSPIGIGQHLDNSNIHGCNLVCPSSPFNLVQYTYSDGLWGDALWTNYIYVGGLTLATIGGDTANWGNVPPAVRENDTRSQDHVLAADEVFYANYAPRVLLAGSSYRINHAKRGDVSKVDFQNILYGDGHVTGQGAGYYGGKSIDATNYSVLAQSAYFYWAGTQGGQIPIAN